MTIVTGAVPGLTRTEGRRGRADAGREVIRSASKRTDLVVGDAGSGSTAGKVAKPGIRILAD
jgi:DNA ligase (NAD+)